MFVIAEQNSTAPLQVFFVETNHDRSQVAFSPEWENIIHQILSSEYRSLEAAQICGLSKGVPCANRKYYSPWCITCVSSSWEKNLSSETLKLQIKVPLKELVFASPKTGNKCRVVDGVKSIRYFYYFAALRALKYKPNVCSQR